MKENIKVKENSIQLYSGKYFSPLNPDINQIDIEDIAHSLSMQCRFTGHCTKFYSIAQHSVLVSRSSYKEDALYGLLHDASEAYLTDLSSPLKRTGQFENFINFEKRLQETIYKRFGLRGEVPTSVKVADLRLLATERRDLMKETIEDWNLPHPAYEWRIEEGLSPKRAKKLFLEEFNKLIIMKYYEIVDNMGHDG